MHPGGIVAIVDAGPIGLSALLTAQFYASAQIIMIDLDDNRLEMAKPFGATATVNSADGQAMETVMKMTVGVGVDAAVAAIGLPDIFKLCEEIVASDEQPIFLRQLERLWNRNLTITTRLVDTASTPMLLNLHRSNRIGLYAPDPAPLQARSDRRRL